MTFKSRMTVFLGAAAATSAALVFLLGVGSLPGWYVPPRWVMFGTFLAASCTALICTVLVKQTEKIDALHASLAQAYAELERSAKTDSLTGLRNRDAFLRHMKADGREAGWIVLGDLDHFKLINDRHGHHIGDMVLAAVGEVIRANSREEDLCARLGGEEFVIYLPGSAFEDAKAYAERLRRAIQMARISPDDGELLSLTMSIGIAPFTGADLSESLRCADSAMYAAKLAGRDRVMMSQAKPRLVAKA